MSLVNKTVFTVNAETNKVDRWKCIGSFNGTYHKRKERLYILNNGKKNCILPARCVFSTEFEAIQVSKK